MIPGREEQEPERSFTVPPELGGLRLDAVLARLAPDASRGRWKGAVQASLVRVGETTVKRPNRLMNPGETIHARLPAAAPSTDPAGRPIQELTVLHEDEAIVVVDKQPGLVVHPNERHGAGGTLADLLVERYGELPSIQSGPFPRPGVVHRLDRLTSGVMVVGRTVEALERLKAQFQERTVEKHYLAIVHGVPRFSSEWLEKRIAPDPRNPRRVRVLPDESEEEGREASTFYEVLESFETSALLDCRPRTGRTHQIRVHMQSAGHPIVGDRIYKAPGPLARPLPEDAPVPARQALHARSLAFEHPGTGERVQFEAGPPGDFQALLDFLRGS